MTTTTISFILLQTFSASAIAFLILDGKAEIERKVKKKKVLSLFAGLMCTISCFTLPAFLVSLL